MFPPLAASPASVGRDLFDLSVQAMTMSNNAALTIGARLWMMAQPAAMLHREPHTEAVLMVTEKFEAAFDGVRDATLATIDLSTRMMFGHAGLGEAMHAPMKVVRAGFGPAARRVSSNARRLNGPAKGGKR